MIVLYVLLSVILAYTGVCTLYSFGFALAGVFRKNPVKSLPTNPLQRAVVFLPGYKEDAVLPGSALAALNQTYPRTQFDVVVIADSLQPQTLQKLRAMPIQVIPVSFDVSTKAKALQAALDQLPNDYDVAVVLDADNHMAPDCLSYLMEPFSRGWKAVQGHRVAKNVNTSVAVLDAISEEINNHILRKGHRAAGLSAALIGSGMAFDYQLFKKVIAQVQVVSGFDKEMECVLLRQGVMIEYAEQALIYDEKVQNEAVFEKQRTRWHAATLRIMQENLGPGFKALLHGNVDYFNKAYQTLLLPRLVLLGTLSGLSLLILIPDFRPIGVVVISQLILLVLSFYMGVPANLREMIGWKELSKLPSLFWRFVRSTLQVGKAKDQFLHTPHGTPELEGAEKNT